MKATIYDFESYVRTIYGRPATELEKLMFENIRHSNFLEEMKKFAEKRNYDYNYCCEV